MRILFLILISVSSFAQLSNRISLGVPHARTPYLNSIVESIPSWANSGTVLSVIPSFDQGTITYQWYRDASTIGSATSSTYTLTSSDIGHDVYCLITSTASGVTTNAKSSTCNVGEYYYISASGSGSNTGHTSGSPWDWTTFAAITLTKYSHVFFNKGDSFYVSNYTITVDGVQIDAYGSGAIPIIYGSGVINTNTWTNLGSNIWSTTMTTPPLWVMKNEIASHLAETAWITITALPAANQVTVATSALSGYASTLVGAKVRLYEQRWSLSLEYTVTAYNSGTGVITLDRNYVATAIGLNLILYNQKQFMSALDDWYYDSGTTTLYYQSTVNPNTLNLKAIYESTGLTVSGDNCSIKNIELKHFQTEGIYSPTSDPAKNLTIDSVNVDNIKEFGIIGLTGTDNISITNSTFTNIGFNSVRVATSSGVIFSNNVVSGNGMDKNFGLPSGVVSSPINYAVHFGSITNGITITYNTISNTAYHGISCGRYNSGSIHHNEVSAFMQRFDDGAGIYVNGISTDLAGNMSINYNYVHDDATTNTSISRASGSFGIYLDNHSANSTVDHNIVSNVNGGGVYVNWDTWNSTVTNNTFYNCGNTGVRFGNYPNPTNSPFFTNNSKNIFTGNRILAIDPAVYCIYLRENSGVTGYNPFSVSGSSSDLNYDINPFTTTIGAYNGSGTTTYTFSGWKTLLGKDASSVSRTNFLTWTNSATALTQCKITVNWTASPVTVNLTGYNDLDGNPLGSSVSVPAYGSIMYTL